MMTTWPKEAPIRMLTHAGSNGAWHALIALDPDQGHGVLLAANAAGEELEAAQSQMLRTLMARLVSG